MSRVRLESPVKIRDMSRPSELNHTDRHLSQGSVKWIRIA